MLDLKRPARDLDYPGIQKRLERTIDFMYRSATFVSAGLDFYFPVLDIGESNSFGIEIANEFGFQYYHTVGDLDGYHWYSTDDKIEFNTAMCFEVLEHLKNPSLFLECLTAELNSGALILVSFPRHIHPRFWSTTHFHEYDEIRFKTLATEAGYEILDMEKHFIWPQVTGVRPALRLLKPNWICWQYFYLLRWNG